MLDIMQLIGTPVDETDRLHLDVVACDVSRSHAKKASIVVSSIAECFGAGAASGERIAWIRGSRAHSSSDACVEH